MSALSPLAHQLIETGGYNLLVAPSCAPAKAHDLLDGVRPEQLLTVPSVTPAAAYAMLAALWLRHDGLHECHEVVQKSPDDPFFSALHLHGNARNPKQSVPTVRPMGIVKPSVVPSLRELTTTFSFWHAVMHRREGDFWNSKYWYARCRDHPAHARIAALTATVLADPAHAATAASHAAGLTRGGWDPDALVDLAESADRRPPDDPARQLAVALQRLEWQALFDETARQAVGG